jgi:hypothetical protein
MRTQHHNASVLHQVFVPYIVRLRWPETLIRFCSSQTLIFWRKNTEIARSTVHFLTCTNHVCGHNRGTIGREAPSGVRPQSIRAVALRMVRGSFGYGNRLRYDKRQGNHFCMISDVCAMEIISVWHQIVDRIADSIALWVWLLYSRM